LTAALRLDVSEALLSRVDADVAVIGVFEDERPLRGGAGLVDWRLCGWLSTLVREGQLGGEPGHWILVPAGGRLRAPRLLVGGLGQSSALGSADLQRFALEAGERVAELRASRAVIDPASTGRSLSQESAALSVVAGFGEALSARGADLSLVCAVPPSESVRWRVVLEQAVAKLSFRGFSLVGPGREPPRRPPEVARPAALRS